MLPSAHAMKEKLEAMLSPRLSALGVIWRGDYHWVEPGDIAVRRGGGFNLLKGFGAVMSWGLSLSFIPNISRSRLVYHRTMRSARPDVFEWPRSYRESFSGSEFFAKVDCRSGVFEHSLESYFSGIAPEVMGWFQRVGSIDSIEQ